MFQSPPFPDYGCKDPDIYSCTIVVDPLKIMFIPNFFLLPVLIGIMLHTITFLGMALKKTWTIFRWFLAPQKRDRKLQNATRRVISVLLYLFGGC